MPQVIGNKQKWKEAVEDLELSRRLAKQVLYSPRHRCDVLDCQRGRLRYINPAARLRL